MYNEEQAYEIFVKHIKEWNDFLSKSIEYINNDEEDDDIDIGQFTKKDRQLLSLYNIQNVAVCNPKLLQDFIYPEGIKEEKVKSISDKLWIQKNLDFSQKRAV